jgi:hypothetical protein
VPVDWLQNDLSNYSKSRSGFYLSDSPCGVDCATKYADAEQDHGVCCSWPGAFFSDGATACGGVYHDKHAERKSVSAGLLCEQGLLRHIARAHRATGPTAGEIRFGTAEYRDFSSYGFSRGAESIYYIVCFFERRADCAFAGTVRAYLHSPHLIRRA